MGTFSAGLGLYLKPKNSIRKKSGLMINLNIAIIG
jgi:hypothetical protein